MARQTMESWLIEEQGTDVIKRISALSVAETRLKSVTMSGNTKTEPRMGATGISIVAKGAAYGEDTSQMDEVTLTAVKFGTAVRIAEEDIADNLVNVLDQKKSDWATSFAIMFDNAVFGTNAPKGNGVPYLSIYRALTNADAETGYAANANHRSSAGDVTYGELSELAGIVENGSFADPTRLAYVAHPVFRGIIRGVVDNNGRPIFTESARQGDPDTLFGYPILWSLGAVVTATAQPNAKPTAGGAKGTTGNPLIFFGNLDLAIVGKRSGPESVVIDGQDGLSALTDETILKIRARRAFVLAQPEAWAVLEKTAAA